jgi:hypothetical protein
MAKAKDHRLPLPTFYEDKNKLNNGLKGVTNG